MMAADTLERLGLKRGDYVIKVNNRKVLDGVLEAIGLGGEDKAGQRLTVLRAIDKLDRLGPEGVRQLLGAGPQGRERRLHQGRRARAPDAIDRVLAFTDAKGADQRRDDRQPARGRRQAPRAALEGADELARDRCSRRRLRLRATASSSTPPSCAASNTTPARSTRPS